MMGGREAEATVLSVDLGCDLPELEQCLREAIIETAAYDGGIIRECCFETIDPIPTPRGGRKGKGKEEEASWDELMERMELVANRLPKLSTISFDWTIRSPRLGNSFPVRCMAMLLEMERDTLSGLSLKQWGSTLAGTRQDFERFFRALGDCRQLKSFLVDWDCQFDVTDFHQSREEMMMTADQWVADSILGALSGLGDGLERVTFLAGRNSYSAKAMKALCSTASSSSSSSSSSGEGMSLHITNCSLTKHLVEAICGPTSTISALHLEDIQQDDDDVAQVLRDLIWRHSSLKRFSFDGILRIASTLMEGMDAKTSLEEVSMEVWCHSRYDPRQEEEEEARASATPTSPSLGLPSLQNIPLKKLHLEIWDMDPTESLEMANALVVSSKDNDPHKNPRSSSLSQLGELHLEFNFDDDVGDALRQEIKDTVGMLSNSLGEALAKANTSIPILQEIQIAFGEGCGTFARLDREPSYEQLKYWLHLNKAGRGKLLGGSLEDQPLWLDTLLSSNDDIDVAYWILSSNPGLFFSTT